MTVGEHRVLYTWDASTRPEPVCTKSIQAAAPVAAFGAFRSVGDAGGR